MTFIRLMTIMAATGAAAFVIMSSPLFGQTPLMRDPADVPYLPTVTGLANPQVTQANIHQTICVSGWTKKIRPPVQYTNALKKSLMASQHLAGTMADYELDHEMSLEDGGHPSDPRNLWMQPYAGPWGARKKDQVETRLKALVCQGKVTLVEAQYELQTDWVAAYKLRVSK